MKKQTHFYVSRKSPLTWLMALCMICSAAIRITILGMKGIEASQNLWTQFLLPLTATLLYAAIAFWDGEEFFYKTAIPVWMMSAYAGIWAADNISSRMIVWLFWIALVFFAFLYTELTAGTRYHSVWLLVPIIALTIATVLYYHREAIIGKNRSLIMPLIPDLIALLGALLLCFDIRVHPVDEYHPTWGDRSDGRRIRSLPPLNQVSPYIMVTRCTSMNLFSESFEITAVDRYIRQKRREGLTNFGITHVFLACYCRAVAKYPGLNRFIAGQKIYTHGEDIQFCMTIKKEMTSSAPETEIKVHLSPRDTAEDVYRKMSAEVEKVKSTPLNSDFDKTAHILMLIPGVILKFTVWLLKTMDYFGLLPKFLLEVSPFHGSVFFTSMGSLGIPPIYHHLYDFGNLPVFGSFGCKRRALELQEDGTVVQRKYIDFKFSMDERIVDGFYYAAFFKYYKRIFQHPEVLDQPPEEVISDID